MKNRSFVPLHVHSEFSALDGASRVKDLVKKAAASGMPALAITDHGVMNSLVSFYKKAREAGVKPIVGCETYITPYGRSRFDKIKLGDGEKNAHHLCLLAKNKTGAKNLNIIESRAHLEGFYYKPRADYDLLREHSEGLIATTACLGGAIPQALLKGNYEEAKNIAQIYKDIFMKGRDKDDHDFYLELQDHGDPKQDEINRLMIQLGKELNIPLVGTNDSHFTNKDDKEIHDIILYISTGGSASKPKGLYYTPEHYFKTPEEMWGIQIFKENPEALINTVRIAEKCNYIMELGNNALPDFPVPDGFDQASYLRHLTYEGLKQRYDHVSDEIMARADYELNTVISMGFPGYLLIVWDFIDWAKRNGIEVGPGRGSAAGSIICYSIGITDIDPLPHGLLFERFLNPDRVSMPDIDVDFCIERRQEVMNYVAQKYGDDRVCQIVTFGTMGAKQAFKDVARVLDLPYGDSDRLSKLIPKELDITLAQALESEDFRMAVESDPRAKKIVDLAQRLEGMVRNTSTHAAGVIISRDKLEEVCPLMQTKEKKSKDTDDDDVAVKLSSQTQLEQKDAEDLGLLKMDFLGLRNLTMIRNTMQLIRERHGIEIDWHAPDMRHMDDQKVYELITSGRTLGMFQIEGDGMTKLVLRMKPSFFGDLSAILALFRPGPLQSKMDDLYVDCKHGRREIEYLHPDVEVFLKDTYGTMIYQEQIMQIAQTMSGYSLGEADLLRRAMGKKKPEEMAKQKDRFLSGAAIKGYETKLAEDTFEKMARFAEYGFNRAHSAAYAVITYRTAWLKTYYPAEFMASLMTSLSGKNDKILSAVRDCNSMGIKVLPPDINESGRSFSVTDDNNIRFGLLSVKGIGESFIESIIQQRKKDGAYLGLVDFCKRVHHKTFNARSIENLIKCGAFDRLDRNRAQLIDSIETVLPSSTKDQKNAAAGQVSLFGDISSYTMPKVATNTPPFDSMQELEFERELTGIYISGHPLKALDLNHQFHFTHEAIEIEAVKGGPQVIMCGILRDVKKIITKKGQPMAFFQIEDLSGIVSGVMFSDNFNNYSAMIEDNQMLQFFGVMDQDRDGTAQVRVNKVRTMDGLKAAIIDMPPDIDDSTLLTLQKAVQIFKGEVPLVFHFQGSHQYVVAEPKFWITYNSSFLDTIEKIVGKGKVRLE